MNRADADGAGIAIIGMGAIFPGAADLDGYWHNLAHGVDAIGNAPAHRLDPAFFDPQSVAPESVALDRFRCHRGGFVDGLASFDPTAFGMMPVSVAAAEPDQLIALSTAAAAIDDAGGPEAIAKDANVAVIIGRGGYLTAGLIRLDQRLRMAEQLVRSLRQLVPGVTDEELRAVRAEFQHQLGPYQADNAIGLVPNLVASRIANRFDFSGPAYTVDAACASSLIAVDHALRLLRSGECDVVIAGGVHHCDDLVLWGVFSHLGAVSASGQSRPFSRDADGLLIGEGTGMMVLKRLDDAEAADDRVYAVIRGLGVSSDGRESTVMRPRVAGQVLALRRAWDGAGLDPGTIGLMEAHGTATPAGDAAELSTLTQVFGPAVSSPVPVGSVKSMIGHAMPAAGAAGMIKAALALHHRTLPPTLHCEEPHPALAGTRFRPITETEPWEASSVPRRAGINSFGFGGINAHAVFEEHAPRRAAPGRRAAPVTVGAGRDRSVASVDGRGMWPDGVLLCAADDVTSLLAQLDDPSAVADRPGRMRLAIVNPTPERVAVARKAAAAGLAWRGRMDIWFSPRPLLRDGGRVAFMFPGIEATVAAQVDDVAAAFGLAPLPRADTTRLGYQAIAVFALGRLLDAALGAIGIRPDVIAGHSIGEWNGMVAAGMLRPETLEPSLVRFAPEAIGVAELVYAAAGCAATVAASAVDGIPDVVVSHDNCPHQSILCGTEQGMGEAVPRLQARRVLVSELPFRSGFHSPMFLPRLRTVREAFADLPLERASVALWSATTCEPYPDDPSAIRELAARHLIEPIRFRELTMRLYEEGVRAFVQVGIGSLVGFVDDTLKAHDHLATTAATATGTGMDQLLRVAAALWVEGAQPGFDGLMPFVAPAPAVLGSANGNGGSPARWRTDSIHSRPVALGTQLVSLAALPPLRAVAPPHALAPPRVEPVEVPPPLAAVDTAVRRHISVDRCPWVVDHCLTYQRHDWPAIADRFPVIPLTTMIRWLIERGACTQPHRVVTAVERIRALRWLPATPPADVVLSAVADGPDRVDVAIDGYAQATVVFGDRAPTRPTMPSSPVADEEPSLVSAAELYEHRWGFHGPQFHAIHTIHAISDGGIRGRLRVLDAPGSLLDGAGQLVGYWAMARTAVDRIVLPRGVDRLELYGPEPPVGTIVDCTVRITDVERTSMRADIELAVGGRMWSRVVGWTEHRFEIDDVLFDVMRFPEHHLISEVQASGWVLTPERWSGTSTRDHVMRQYLTGPERDHYQALNPLAQRQWLLGRIAAKDAVRDWLWGRGAGPLFPAEVEVTNGTRGEPLVAGNFDADLRISLAHGRTLAVAMVSLGSAVGIDIEAVTSHGDRFDQMVLTTAEQALVPETDRDRWVTRFWVAKEAVAKAAGTGLNGRPKHFEVTTIAGQALLVGDRWVDTDIVSDKKGDEFVVGWTRISVSQ